MLCPHPGRSPQRSGFFFVEKQFLRNTQKNSRQDCGDPRYR
jgi:hypothetical protein